MKLRNIVLNVGRDVLLLADSKIVELQNRELWSYQDRGCI